MRTAPLASILAVIASACGGATATPTSHADPTSQAASAPADYEVHEWGLVRAEPGDVLRVGAIAPPVDTVPLVVLKPVLYFHTATAITLRSVTVTAPAGDAIAEAWPAVPTGPSVVWSSVALDPAGPCTPSPLPSATDPFCTALGSDMCETAGLAVARTGDGACVTTGGTTDRFLFYRGRSTALTPPLRFERSGASGDAQVTNESDDAIPGMLVRIWTAAGEARASVVAPPAPHASIMVPSAAPAATLDMPVEPPSLAEARTAVRASLLEIGLTSDEADAFLRAWDPTLFPSGALSTTLSLGLTAPVESFVYFLPSSATDRVATLTLDPPPRAVRRAIAVWSVLAPSGATH